MIPVSLTQIKTSDGILLDGIVVEPKQKSGTALIWVHGLTSYFYSSPTLVSELSRLCTKNRIGYFKFNTRGHDIAVRGQRKDKFLGTIYEIFEDCVPDIRAMIRFARLRGYKKIILAGHSTGAQKIVYYVHKTRDRNVKGLALLGAANDISAEIRRTGKREYEKNLRRAQSLHRKDPTTLFMSQGYLFTARRFLSLHTPGTAEDTFPYYDASAQWKAMESIRTPLVVIFGSRDECLDRPAQKLIETFRAHAPLAKSFSCSIIKNANHGFKGKEKQLSHSIIYWIKSIIKT